jgi:hypothetical protein
MKNTPRRAKSLAEAVPGDLNPTGTARCYKNPPFWRPVAPPDPAVVAQLKREREEELADQAIWIARLPEDERPTVHENGDPELLQQSWAEAARTQKRLDPEGYALSEAREKHFIETGSDEPFPEIRVYRKRTR